MIDAVIYTKIDCPWCHKAVALLKEKGFEIKELVLGLDYTRDDLIEKMGGSSKGKLTVPQIFIDDQLVGGYDHLEAYFTMKENMNGT